MTIGRIKALLEADVLYGEDTLDDEVKYAFSSDMMSDVLAYADEHSALITGLCNPQVVRTAEMLDIVCLVFVRGKQPQQEMLQMAENLGITVLTTEHTMFDACGILYHAGLRGGSRNDA